MLVTAILILLLIALIYGGYKTLQRNVPAAILCAVFAFPLWVIWAFLELFTGPVKQYVLPVETDKTYDIDYL